MTQLFQTNVLLILDFLGVATVDILSALWHIKFHLLV